jgi:hypothetical protein
MRATAKADVYTIGVQNATTDFAEKTVNRSDLVDGEIPTLVGWDG